MPRQQPLSTLTVRLLCRGRGPPDRGPAAGEGPGSQSGEEVCQDMSQERFPTHRFICPDDFIHFLQLVTSFMDGKPSTFLLGFPVRVK